MQKTPRRKGLKTTVAALVFSLAATGAVVPMAQANTNVVPDDALRTCVNRDINIWTARWKPEVGNRDSLAPVTAQDINKFLRPGTFKCDNKGVRSLEGLQYATDPKAITSISVKFNKITDITPISKLSNLKGLYLDNNDISALPKDMTGLSGLKSLYIQNTKLNNIESVKGLKNLELLNVSNYTPGVAKEKKAYPGISSLAGVEGLTKLTYLNVAHNVIRDLTPVRNLTNLSTLIVDNNHLSDMSAVSNLKKLNHFEFQNNNTVGSLGVEPKILNISALAGKNEMKYLRLDNNNISDITALSGMSNLTHYQVDHNKIADLSPLAVAVNAKIKKVDTQRPQKFERVESGGQTIIDISKFKTVTGTTPVVTQVMVLGGAGGVKPFSLSGSKIILNGVWKSDIRIFYKDNSYVDVVSPSSSINNPTPQPTPSPSTVFTDVKSGDQFYNEIMWLANSGITTGWKVGNQYEYRPLSNVERGAMAAFFYRMAGKPAYTPPAKPTFKDVPTTHDFYKEIEWMASKKITTGWEDGTFRPENPVNRDAMAAFFYRMAGKPAYTAPSKSPFTDVKTNDQFYKEISWLANKGITTGWEDGTFRPVSAINRDAMAAFIYRYKANI